MELRIYLMRHGETAWSLSGQHTGRADIPLTKNGEEEARQLGERLKIVFFQSGLLQPVASRTANSRSGRTVAEPNDR